MIIGMLSEHVSKGRRACGFQYTVNAPSRAFKSQRAEYISRSCVRVQAVNSEEWTYLCLSLSSRLRERGRQDAHRDGGGRWERYVVRTWSSPSGLSALLAGGGKLVALSGMLSASVALIRSPS